MVWRYAFIRRCGDLCASVGRSVYRSLGRDGQIWTRRKAFLSVCYCAQPVFFANALLSSLYCIPLSLHYRMFSLAYLSARIVRTFHCLTALIPNSHKIVRLLCFESTKGAQQCRSCEVFSCSSSACSDSTTPVLIVLTVQMTSLSH